MTNDDTTPIETIEDNNFYFWLGNDEYDTVLEDLTEEDFNARISALQQAKENWKNMSFEAEERNEAGV